MPAYVLVRGGGDLATGVAVRLHRCGFSPIITELEQPLAVRREVAFAEAVYRGAIEVEGVRAERVGSAEDIPERIEAGVVPVLVDPDGSQITPMPFLARIDARMRKRSTQDNPRTVFTVGLGPGFTAGVDCDAVVETHRGPSMGRVIWEGSAEADTGVPGAVAGRDVERVLRAAEGGLLSEGVQIGSVLDRGDRIARLGETELRAPFRGVLRGLLHDGVTVDAGNKVGDLDPRGEPALAFRISDKALAVAGGVLEALLSQHAIRTQLGRSDAAQG